MFWLTLQKMSNIPLIAIFQSVPSTTAVNRTMERLAIESIPEFLRPSGISKRWCGCIIIGNIRIKRCASNSLALPRKSGIFLLPSYQCQYVYANFRTCYFTSQRPSPTWTLVSVMIVQLHQTQAATMALAHRHFPNRRMWTEKRRTSMALSQLSTTMAKWPPIDLATRLRCAILSFFFLFFLQICCDLNTHSDIQLQYKIYKHITWQIYWAKKNTENII